jgi:hypothetical protein
VLLAHKDLREQLEQAQLEQLVLELAVLQEQLARKVLLDSQAQPQNKEQLAHKEQLVLLVLLD